MCAARLHATRLGHWLRKEGHKSHFWKPTRAVGDTTLDTAALLAEWTRAGLGRVAQPVHQDRGWQPGHKHLQAHVLLQP